jgi:hypothetical protein
MPTNYTPVPGNAPAVITLPSDLDAASAESVNLAFRALADNMMGLTAILDQPNEFTGAPIIVNVTNAETAALVTQTIAADDANAANIWKAVLGFNVGSYYVNIYVGRDGAAEQFIFAVNGVWNAVTQVWIADDHLHPSLALILSVDGARISHRGAGFGSWTTWPTTSGDLSLGGTLFAAAAAVVGDIAAGTGNFAYAPARVRTSMMPTGVVCAGGHNGGNGEVLTNGSRSYVYFSLNLPSNSPGGTIEIVHHQSTATPSVFRLEVITCNFAAPAACSSAWIGTATGPTASGYYKATIDLTLLTFDQTKEYRLQWYPGDAADAVEGIRMVAWEDNGPFNDL